MIDASKLALVPNKTLSEIRSTLLPFGIRLKPTVKRTEEVFNTFPDEVKENVLGVLNDQLSLIKEAAVGAKDRRNFEISGLRLILNALSMKVPDNFYDLITEEDIVEVYSLEEKTQLWRNSTFLDKCSYDLLTVMTFPYTDLFERDEHSAELLELRSREVTQSAQGPVPWNMDDHFLVEKMSEKKWRYRMKMGWICPVFSTSPENYGQRVAWASTLQVSRVGFGITTP